MSLARKWAMGHTIAAALLLASACEALPEETIGRASTPTDAQFRAMMSAAMVPDNAFAEDRNLTAILSRSEITLDQRLQVLAMRAAARSTTGANLMGAIADYEEIIQTAPQDHRLLRVARDEKAYSETQKTYLDRRIAAGPGQATNWSNYFNDLMQLGRHQDAIAFAKTAKLRLSTAQAERLTEAGYLCEGVGYSGPSFQWGSAGAGYHVVYWCDTAFAAAP
jgi:tetratricopeptide (TPR) repeat protein